MAKSERWAQIGGEIYSVEFLNNGWAVMRFDDGVGTTVFKAGKGDAGKAAAIAHLEDMRKVNPLEKKKRSAKQLANDKRLGRMAKARAAKKRGKKKTTRRKVTKRKVNPKRSSGSELQKRYGLQIIFGDYNGAMHYLMVTPAGRFQWTTHKGRAMLFRTKEMAKPFTSKAPIPRNLTTFGIAPEYLSVSELRQGK